MLWRTINRTSREILAGNRTVLEDIGKVTASFVSVFHDCRQFDIEKIDRFVETLRPGKAESDGQALLARAFLHYYQASSERDIDRKHEQMFLANCYAILHEHIRLEPYIGFSPKRCGNWITPSCSLSCTEWKDGIARPMLSSQAAPPTGRT